MLKFRNNKDNSVSVFLLQSFLREDLFLCIGVISETIVMQLHCTGSP